MRSLRVVGEASSTVMAGAGVSAMAGNWRSTALMLVRATCRSVSPMLTRITSRCSCAALWLVRGVVKIVLLGTTTI